MRTIRSNRSYGETRAADVQTMINENPVTVTVYRVSSDLEDDTRTRTTYSFQARIDAWRNSQRDARHNISGHAIDLLFLMTTCWSTDVNGSSIVFEQDDELVVGSDTYTVVAKVPYSGWKNEGILLLKQ